MRKTYKVNKISKSSRFLLLEFTLDAPELCGKNLAKMGNLRNRSGP